ncbi:hypothetical protein GYW75_04375 [Gilliamella sp. ESL0232]|nr:hypothetical protein [Gilliamella sp. ESL0232]
MIKYPFGIGRKVCILLVTVCLLLNKLYLMQLLKLISLLKKSKRILIAKITSHAALQRILLKSNVKHYALQLMTIFLCETILSGNAIAVLSATTTNVIHGSAPYLTFDDNKSKANSMSGVLSITLSDGRKYDKSNHRSSKSSPIILPEENQSVNDIKMFLPKKHKEDPMDHTKKAKLNDVLLSFGLARDDDGDEITVTGGELTIDIRNVDGKQIRNYAQILDPCYAPYSIYLKSDDATLSTRYGIPASSGKFIGSSVTYYISPKVNDPYTCFSQPNLNHSYGTHLGPAEQWDRYHGFKPQNIQQPFMNFPNTAANGLHFYLMTAGGLAREFTYTKLPVDSGININVTHEKGKLANIARIDLMGPSYTSTVEQAATAVPTTFIIYADKAKKNKIYSFKIDKWFIANSEEMSYLDAKEFCMTLEKAGYHVANTIDMTNGNNRFWSGGLPGQPNNYQRRIGGSLFAEWGSTRKNYYHNSDFTESYYWSTESYPLSLGWQYHISSAYGSAYYASSDGNNGALCVH